MKKISLISFSLFTSLIISNALATATNNYDIGFYKKNDLEMKPGSCVDCIGQAASFYFNDEQILQVKDNPAHAFLWNNTSDILQGILSSEGHVLTTPEHVYEFSVTPKIKTNLSYYNEKSIAFFNDKEVIVKGVVKDNSFVATSIWPVEYSFNQALSFKPPKQNIKQLVQNESLNSFSPQVLWSKNNKNISLKNKPVLGFILNGAQGDDDEAHGGHFAVATGAINEQGQFNNLLVNNFYGLNSFSEKGIIASRLALDLYQADLNRGQSWYRPSYMLFLVLTDDKLSRQYQDSINDKFNEFYQHHFEYNHARANCSGINMQILRGLGWNIPKAGVESFVKGVGAIPYVGLTDSFDSAKKGSNYMMSEKTNLYPFVAFNAVGEDVLKRIVKGKNLKSPFEKELYNNLEAIVYVKIPQFPSSRAFGLAPIFSFDEYMSRVPKDKKDWKIVPVEPRPFPNKLKDNKVEGFTLQPYVYAIAVTILFLFFLGYFIYRLSKKSYKRFKQ